MEKRNEGKNIPGRGMAYAKKGKVVKERGEV